MMQETAARLLLLGFASIVFYGTPAFSRCASMENQHLYPSAPSLEINTVEFPDHDVLPTGYNITISCTSNVSKENWGWHYYGQPYWIQHFFNYGYLGGCGGGDGDSENSKVCTYIIQNATERDSGNYSCLTRNQISCTVGTISLHFEKPSPPKFTLSPPHYMNVSAGSTVTLTCKATGIPRPGVSWYKDGQPVAREDITRVNGISLLPLKNVQPYDQGKYWCEAENAEGRNRSSSTHLKIFSRPTVLRHPKNVSIYLEDKAITVIFTCEASGFPLPVISWLKNNSTATSGKIIQNGSISSLVLRLQNRVEPAKYRCIAENSLGETSSKEATLVIRSQTNSLDAFVRKRTFYLHPENVFASRGENVVFICATQGSPVPNITWLKDGLTTVDGKANYFKGEESATSVLRISSVEERHRGRYACKATSRNGNITSRQAMLSIKDDISTSPGVSRVLWISVAMGTVLLFAVVLSICVVHNKCKKVNYEVSEEIKEESRFPHLDVRKDITSQLRDDQTAPRYQMTNMA